MGLCRGLRALGLALALAAGHANAGQGFLPELEPNGSSGTATPLGNALAGGVVRAHLTPSGDVDFYSFVARAGDRIYAATMTAFADGGSTDSLLQVLAPDGVTVIASDDNQGSFGTSASSIAGATLTANGTHFLRVSTAGGSTQIRPYQLHFQLRRGAPTPETEPSNLAPLPASGWVSGTFASGDVDRFSLALNAGDSVFLSLDLDPERDTVSWAGAVGLGPFESTTLSTPLETDPANPRSQSFFMTVKSAGTYQIVVSAMTGSPTSTWVLSATVHPNTPASAICTTYSSSDVPKAIPDLGEVTSTLVVPGHPRIEDLDVSVSLDHARMDNLDAQLISPAGNDNGLFEDIGAGAGASPGQQVMNVTFDDEAAVAASFPIVSGVAYLPGSGSQRIYSLSWFDGEDAGGTWTLDLRDDASGSTGTLQGWSITVCEPPPPAACPPGRELTTVFTSDFDSGDGGFTATGTPAVEWQRGTPASFGCNSGASCWKTDLAGNYDPNTSQDLRSPVIDLLGLVAPITLTWAQKYQMDSAQSDHAFVEVSDGVGANPQRVFEHLEPDMVSLFASPSVAGSAGWGLRRADLGSYAGQSARVRFHLDSGPTTERLGLAIDDVAVTGCALIVDSDGDGLSDAQEAALGTNPNDADSDDDGYGDGVEVAAGTNPLNAALTPCGNGTLQVPETCDDGDATGGDGCSATCQVEPGFTCGGVPSVCVPKIPALPGAALWSLAALLGAAAVALRRERQ